MKEACRLLNKSIIRVEQPDIQLEEDEEEREIIAMGKKESLSISGLKKALIKKATRYPGTKQRETEEQS